MRIGQMFKHRHIGKHNDVTLVILYDADRNERILFNIDYGIKIGPKALLYAKPIGVATKEQLSIYKTAAFKKN